MFSSLRTVTLSSITGLTCLLLPGQDAQAGPFLDWLFGRPVLVYPSPQVVGYAGVPAAVATPYAVAPALQTTNDAPAWPVAAPTTVAAYAPAYPVAAPATVAGYAAANPVAAPTTIAAYAPGATVAPAYVTAAQPIVAAPVAQPVVVGYAPNYRTNWLRVPVTYYRPVVNYTAAGYPATAAIPCNTYAWQAQRVPTIVNRPWIPFTSAPVTYGYAPVPTTTLAPSMPACQGCPGTSSGTVTVPSTIQGTPAYGAAPAGATLDVPAQSPDATTAPAADQAPALLPGSFPVSPASNQPISAAPSGFGSRAAPRPATNVPAIPTDSNSRYRVTPIPAPDVRTFESQRQAPTAPPLLQGRERTVSTPPAKSARIEKASWGGATTSTTAKAPPAAVSNSAAPKALWNDGGWHSAK